MKYVALILLFVSATSLADVAYLSKGSIAPNDGYLFDPASTNNLRIMNEQLKTCSTEIGFYDARVKTDTDTITACEQKGDILLQQYTDTTQQLTSLQKHTFWRDALYFGLGIATAGFGAYEYTRLHH